jgi:hypothetical protein
MVVPPRVVLTWGDICHGGSPHLRRYVEEMLMRIAILDDYHDTVRRLPCFAPLAGHDVTVWNDHVQDTDRLAARPRDVEALVLIRERTRVRADLLERPPSPRLISQRGVYPPSTSPPARGWALSSPRICTPTRRLTRPPR